MVSRRVAISGECVRCRGTKFLCGLTYCPILATTKASLRLVSLRRGDYAEGSSPPSVFIGWKGYPRVSAAVAAPPIRGDTSEYDLPERWLGLGIDDVLSLRLSLVRAASIIDVRGLSDRFVNVLRDVALSEKPVDVSFKFLKPPRPEVMFDPYVPPMGPVGVVERLEVGSTYYGRYVEKVFSDTDLRASEAMVYLYRSGVPISRIAKVLSVGAMGLGRLRRLVPTRWSITATDKVLSDYLVSKIRYYPSINSIYVFVRRFCNNLFAAILLPSSTWWFEWLEAWFPGTTWNRFGTDVAIEGDYEGPRGRSSYPEIGGCYYASRLAVAEYLHRIRRKCVAVLLREIYSGFDVNIGVWFVRENIREMLSNSKPLVLNDESEVCRVLDRITRLGCKVWASKSVILGRYLRHVSLGKWFR